MPTPSYNCKTIEGVQTMFLAGTVVQRLTAMERGIFLNYLRMAFLAGQNSMLAELSERQEKQWRDLLESIR